MLSNSWIPLNCVARLKTSPPPTPAPPELGFRNEFTFAKSPLAVVKTRQSRWFLEFRVDASFVASVIAQHQLMHAAKGIPIDHLRCATRGLPSDAGLQVRPNRCAAETTYDLPKNTSHSLLVINCSRIDHRLGVAVP